MPLERDEIIMKTRNAFDSYHPIVNFVYFTLIIVFSMFFMHPVCLVISFCFAFCYSVKLKGKKALKFNILYMLPMIIAAALINPAFNHEGATVITYLKTGNPLTLESILYGLAAALMLASVICWFSCYNEVMTTDKFIYLFGKAIPSMSLILSMVLRFVPRFREQIKIISNAQKCIGRDINNGSILSRAKNGLTILSIMITWALENAIETADSMKSRGFGLPGRTAFSIFKLDKRDKIVFAILLSAGIYIIAGSLFGGVYFRYFPYIKGTEYSFFSVSVFFTYFALCALPVIIEILEDLRWNAIKSKI